MNIGIIGYGSMGKMLLERFIDSDVLCIYDFLQSILKRRLRAAFVVDYLSSIRYAKRRMRITAASWIMCVTMPDKH